MTKWQPLKIGLVINPIAGMGGPAGLRGSDDPKGRALAKAEGYALTAAARVSSALKPMLASSDSWQWLACAGDMGADLLFELGFQRIRTVYTPSEPSAAEDTKMAALALQKEGVDVLLFAGGDGTARDLLDVIDKRQVALGIPCGVKMHSGVFARHPLAVQEILQKIQAKTLVTALSAEVRDIDEAAFQRDQVVTRYYGDMLVPDDLRYLQSTKVGGVESEALAHQEIAADVIEQMQDDVIYFMGGGRTVAAVMATLGLPNSLLGVDVIQAGVLLAANCSERALLSWAQRGSCRIVVSIIGGQGHVFGRGNQQFSPTVIRAVGIDNIIPISTKTKLQSLLHGIIVDTGDAELDEALVGLRSVCTGYEDAVLIQWSTT